MAKNPFDQFDAPAAANPFDQFDTPVAAPPQGIASASPTAAVEPGLGGGAASKTVSKGFSLPPVLDPLGINQPPQPVATFKAGTPGYSVLGELPPPTPMPTGVRDDFIGQVRGELVRATPAQRLALANDPSLKGQVAKSLLDSEPTTFAPRAPATMRETPLPTQIGMDIRRNVTNPVALGAISGLAGVGQVLPGLVQAGADLVGANDVADFAAGVSATGRQISAPLRPKAGNERLVFDVFNSITQSAPTLLTGLGGGPAMTMLFTQSAAQEYSEGRSRGLSGDQAAARAGIMAGAEVIGERLGFGEQMKLLRGIARGMPIEQLAPTFAREVVKNATGEQLTTLIQFLGDKYGPGALNPEAKLADYLTQAGDTLKVSLGQSAVMAGGPAAIQKARSTFRRQERDQLSRAVDMPAANPFDQFDATATTAPTAAPVQAHDQAVSADAQASATVAAPQPGEATAPTEPQPQSALTPAGDGVRRGRDEAYGIDVEMRQEGDGYVITTSDTNQQPQRITSGAGGVYLNDMILNREGDFVPARQIVQVSTGQVDESQTPYKPASKAERDAVVKLVAEIRFARETGNAKLAKQLESRLFAIAQGTASATTVGNGDQQRAPAIAAMTDEEWANTIGPIEGPARADGPNEQISVDEAKLLRKMVAKIITDGVAAGRAREQIVGQIDALTQGGIKPSGWQRINELLDGGMTANQPDTQRVSTVTGRQIETRLRVLDASQLQAATGELQPRDRSRAASDEQINTIAAQLDPQRLGASAEADRGAPIIGPDMIVESGNGRVQGIRRAYAMYPERAQAYRDFLTAQGYDLTGINEPVLVRERLTPLSDQDRVAFVQEANQSATMDLTPVERAKIDVSALTDGVVEVWYGGEITDAANRDFVRGFIGQLPQAQRNGLLDDNGALSPDGAQRIRRALLAAAYEDRDLLVKLVESTDDNIKSIGNALFDSSGQWLQMRRMAREGLIDSSYDVTAELVQAARVVDQLRQSRGKVQEWLAQEDLATPRDPIVDEFVRAFYNANLTRAVGRDAIAEVLKAYVDMARSQDTDGLFGDSPLPDQMVRGAVEQRNERNKEPVTGNLFDVAQPQSDAGAQPSVRQGRGGQADSTVSGGGAKPARESAGGQLLANEDRRRAQAQDRNGPSADTEEGVSRGANRDTAGDAPADRGLEARGKASAGQDQNQRFKGATGDVFIKASFTNRQSIYRDAFVELGYDPTEAELLPPDRQFMILADGLKKTYGLALVQKADRANLRDAIDQLLDAYRGLQLMAHVLDLPTKAIGLNGELALGLVKNAGYLGAHYPLGTGDGASAGGIATSTQTIVMPGRSNSFAHEWGHALDFYLANKHSGALANLSDHLREGETLADQFPESTGEAFRHLLNAIFFDRAEQSAKIMELERKIEAATQAGKDTAKLKADLANLMSGASKSRNDRSQFYKSAGDFAKATGSDVDYWRKPTEMLARSFEAYISHKVEAAGGTTEFIGKSDAAYQSDAHIRLAKTFPKDADRYNIFRAYDLLFDAIRSDALLNPNGDAVAEMPAGVRLTDPAVYFDDQIRSAQSPAIKRAWEEEKRAWRVRARELEKLAERPSDPRPLMKRMGDAVRAALVTNRGVLLAMERHYAKTGNQSAANAIRQVMERIATDPGSGRKTFAGGTYAEAVERESRRFMTRLSNIRNAADADMMSDADLAQLTAVLTTTEEYTPQIMQAKNPAINRLGAQLRELLTDLYYYNRNAGLDIGFVKDQGYLPRLIDEPVVTANAAEFVRDATEVYKIIFERDTERPMDADDIALALQALEKRARDAGMDLKRDPELDAYRAARKELTKLLRAMNSIDENDPDSADKIDKAQAALKEFLEQSGDVFEQAYDYIRDVWSGNAAAEYRTRISYGSPENFSSHSPAGSYLKERTLPPEADKILAKYYVQDPIERVTKYLQMSVRKSEYNLRFGRDARGREKNTKLYRMLEQMVNSGVRKEDREMVEAIIGQVTGTLRDQTPGEYQRLLGNAHALGQMALLGRVVLTSLAEPITTAVQTGKPLDALKAVALTIQEIVSTGSVRERRAMARVLGIVAGDYADEMIANRLGGTFAESPNMTKVSANYFRRVGLTGLTNAQRRAAMQLSGSYVLELAHTLDDDQASDSDKGFARAELTDAGMQPEQIEAFVEWSREYSTRMPRHDELMDVDGSLTDMGKIYAVMVGRLVNQAIQSPSAIDRPFRANTPGGRLTYGLLSFTMAFFRNVMMKSIKKVEREYNERGAAQAASVAAFQVLAPIASLYMGHLLVTIMREALLNPDKWEEEEKKEGGFPIKWLAQLAFSRSGFTGLADPLYNALMGVKYQRDLTGLLAGATYGYAAQAVERIVKYFAVNSANTNSAERNAARGLYELTVQPGLAYVTGALPGGPAVGYGLGASYMYMTSPAFKSQWQTWLAGEKESKQKKAGSGQQEDRL